MVMLTVLFLCTGNTCRSPMAEALLGQALEEELGAKASYIKVESAGLGAGTDNPASPLAVAAMAELGLDLSRHRARQATPELLRGADMVITMTGWQKEQALALEPSIRDKLWVLGEFSLPPSGAGPDPVPDVDDPFGQPGHVYRAVREQLARLIKALVAHIRQIVPL